MLTIILGIAIAAFLVSKAKAPGCLGLSLAASITSVISGILGDLLAPLQGVHYTPATVAYIVIYYAIWCAMIAWVLQAQSRLSVSVLLTWQVLVVAYFAFAVFGFVLSGTAEAAVLAFQFILAGIVVVCAAGGSIYALVRMSKT